jgi:hypothetical protein
LVRRGQADQLAHQRDPHLLVTTEQGEKLCQRPHVGVGHHRVVQHHADRTSGTCPRRQRLGDLLVGEVGSAAAALPVDVDRQLPQAGHAERPSARLA